MTMGFRCSDCDEMEGSVEGLASHRMNVHGVNRLKAYSEAGLAVPADIANRQQEQYSRAVVEAAARLGRARTHANTLDGLAWAILALGVLGAVGLVVAEPELFGVAAGSLLSTAVVWGILRAVSLHLHMAVDRIMIEGDDAG